MKKLVCYLIIIIPLLYGCQSQYENPPYNEIERKIRLLPENIDRLVIYENWQKMDSISYIRLNNVKSIIIAPEVDSIPPWISHFEKLITLWSFSTKIKSIPESIGENIALNHLVFDHAKIKKVPVSICKLHNLESLSLMSNEITELPDCILKLEKLKELNLHNNKIKELPKSIYNLHSLQNIILNKNPLDNPEEIRKKFEEKGVKVSFE